MMWVRHGTKRQISIAGDSPPVKRGRAIQEEKVAATIPDVAAVE